MLAKVSWYNTRKMNVVKVRIPREHRHRHTCTDTQDNRCHLNTRVSENMHSIRRKV